MAADIIDIQIHMKTSTVLMYSVYALSIFYRSQLQQINRCCHSNGKQLNYKNWIVITVMHTSRIW